MQINRAVSFIILAMLGFGLMALFTREANAPIVTIATWRSILVAVVFGVWAILTEGANTVFKPTKEQLKIGVPYGLFLALASATFVGGYALTTVANTIFFHNLAPIIAFPLALKVLDEKTDGSAITGALIALGGIALISGISAFNASHLSNPRFLMGDFLAIVSAIGYAGVLVWTKKTRMADLPIVSTLFFAWSIGAIGLVIVALVLGQFSIGWNSLAWTLGLAIICTNIPFYLLNRGMKKVSAGMAALLSMTEVLFATLLGALWYNESLAPVGWLGGGLVVLGVLYPFFAKEETQTASAEPTEEQRGFRNLRAAFWLIMLNVGAFCVLAGMGSMLAWLSLVVMLHIGSGPLNQLLDGRFQLAQRVLVGGLSTIAIIGLFILGTQGGIATTIIVTMIAFAAVLIDQWFAEQESEKGVRTSILSHVVAAIVLAQLFDWLGNGAAGIFQVLALLGIGFIALDTIQIARGSKLNAASLSVRIPAALGFKHWLTAFIFCTVIGGFYAIPAGHEGVVERLGEAQDETLDAGFHFRLPPPVEMVHVIDVQGVRRVVFSEGETPILCGDQSMVTVQASLQYHVSDATEFTYGIAQIDDFISAEARSLLIESLRRTPQETLLTTGKIDLAETLQTALQSRLVSLNLGVTIDGIQIQNITVPLSVQDAFLDVISATEEQTAIINKAQAYAAAAVPIALGEAAATHLRAEASAIRIRRKSEIQRAHFQAFHLGGARSKQLTKDRLYLEHLSQFLREPIIKAPSARLWMMPGDRPPLQEGSE